MMDTYAAKVYGTFTLYHWHCICPKCCNTTRYFSINMNIDEFPICDRCGCDKIIQPVQMNECKCFDSVKF